MSEAGTIRLTRRFHKPTNLGHHEEVHVVFEAFPGRGTVALNGVHLLDFSSSPELRSARITALLRPVNALIVEFEWARTDSPEPAVAPWGDVALEIRGG